MDNAINYFQARPNKPAHLSIGAVVVNENKEILVHHHVKIAHFEDIYLLMRETVEVGESYEQTINRGLMEEFGATGEIITFLGSRAPEDMWFGEINQPTLVQKTTIYFLVQLKGIDESQRKQDDPESGSKLVWKKPEELATLMQTQGIKYKLNDIDESTIVQKAQNYLALH